MDRNRHGLPHQLMASCELSNGQTGIESFSQRDGHTSFASRQSVLMVDGNDIGKLQNHTLTGEGREEVKKVKHTEKQNSRRLSTTVNANFHPQPSTNLSPLTDSSLTSRFRLSLSMIYAFKALLPVSHAFQLVPIPYRSSNRSRIFISGTSNHSGNLFRLFISGCAVVWRAPDSHRTLADSCS